MRNRITVVFNACERLAFKKAALARNIGFPDDEDGRPRYIKRLAMKNFEHNQKHLTDSLAALEICRAQCVVETNPNFFLLPPRKQQAKQTITEGGVPLFLDPLGAVKFIIDIRKQFVHDLDVAIALVKKALAQAGETPDDDPEFDPEDDEEALIFG